MTQKNTIIALIIAIVLITGFYLINYNQNNSLCADCGEGGWQVMNLKCDSKILSENELVKCLTKFELYPLEIITSEIEQGYIEIGGRGLINTPSKNSIKVYKFHQWAADETGNMYLEGMLG